MRFFSNARGARRRSADGTRLGWAVLIALGLHAPLAILLNGRSSHGDARAAESSISLVYPLEVAPAPPAEPETVVHAARKRHAPTAAPSPEAPKAPPAAAEETARGHADEPTPAEAQGAPIDLTQVGGATVVSSGVAGGRGLARGADGRGQGDGRAAHGRGAQGTGEGSERPPGRAPTTPVSLVADSWTCPWPAEAESQPIRERTVVLRAVVSADGRPLSVELLADPGQGFGPAALACAMQARFVPARNAEGEPMRARSPPIRVTFTR